MAAAVVTARTLVTDDGVPIDAVHLPATVPPGPARPGRAPDESAGLAVVVAHGFTGSWQKPAVWRVLTRLNRVVGVVGFDFRGHGRSGGLSTLGDREVRDLAVAVAHARELGYRRVAAVGFSMGASIVLRYAGLVGGLAAVVSVSGPGRWYYRGTWPMRRVHWAAERRCGRFVARTWLQTRISPVPWSTAPVSPAEAASRIAPTPLLVVHGDADPFFPVDHARQIHDAAAEPKELWLESGFGHAEAACPPALVDRIGAWTVAAARPGTGRRSTARQPVDPEGHQPVGSGMPSV